MSDLEFITGYYNTYDEENRLLSRHGSVEFLTTLRYIDKYLNPGMKILDIGAGTGRYSHYFARMGYEVDAVELIEHNIEIFMTKTLPDEKITITQGDATDLSLTADDTYDITLLLGPMYHLFTEEEKMKALAQALRVTKSGGVLFVAYCMSDPSIIGHGFIKGNIHNLLDSALLDPETFETFSTPAEVFELVRTEDIDRLISCFNVKRLHFIGTDMYTNYMRDTMYSMDDETFSLYMKYHYVICERADMTGISHHTLDVLRKE